MSIIVAVTENNIIGRDGDMPWHLPVDLKWFKRKTLGHTLIMGRRTYESFGRPLPGRTTIVLTRNPHALEVPTDLSEGTAVLHAPSLAEAIRFAPICGTNLGELFIGGGAGVYREALPLVNRLYLTRIHAEIEGDTRFPEVDFGEWNLVESHRHEPDEKNEFACTFEVWDRKRAS
ncbi:MAG: dihydrofolate reductase [Planctomycetales bacterium]|nr:dihydrofolate reductase [Planctomycetales bacterium]